MSDLMNFWSRANSIARASLVAGLVAILAATAWLGYWAMRTDYQVLFSDLAQRDAAAMTAELDRMKVHFRLEASGATILVPGDDVHRTRLKLMGRDIPLQGAVGFELFNTVDFGMTDFIQKVNYQRALQGELTRTILSIDSVVAARVHIALPEAGLFKKAGQHAKASVKVALKPGRILSPEQELGIRRLVAASVPDVGIDDVVVIDQNGIALSRPVDIADGGVASSGSLDTKKAAEEYLTRKLMKVLDRALGAGEASASVDVVVDMDQNRVSTEEVVPARGQGTGAIPTGTIVRERQTSRELAADAAGGAASSKSAPTVPTTTVTETDYQTGRRVEHRVVAPGAVRQIMAAIVVRRSLSAVELDRLRELSSLAIGINRTRGDAIALHTLEGLVRQEPKEDLAWTPKTAPAIKTAVDDAQEVIAGRGPGGKAENIKASTFIAILVALITFGALALVGLLAVRRRRSTAVQARLTSVQRERVLSTVKEWLSPAVSATGGTLR